MREIGRESRTISCAYPIVRFLKRLAGSHFGDRLDYNRWNYRVRGHRQRLGGRTERYALINAYHIDGTIGS